MKKSQKPSLWARFAARFSPDCDEVIRLCSERMDRRLTIKERIQLALHGTICSWCQRYDGQITGLRDRICHEDEEAAGHCKDCLSDDKKDALKAALMREAEAAQSTQERPSG